MTKRMHLAGSTNDTRGLQDASRAIALRGRSGKMITDAVAKNASLGKGGVPGNPLTNKALICAGPGQRQGARKSVAKRRPPYFAHGIFDTFLNAHVVEDALSLSVLSGAEPDPKPRAPLRTEPTGTFKRTLSDRQAASAAMISDAAIRETRGQATFEPFAWRLGCHGTRHRMIEDYDR